MTPFCELEYTHTPLYRTLSTQHPTLWAWLVFLPGTRGLSWQMRAEEMPADGQTRHTKRACSLCTSPAKYLQECLHVLEGSLRKDYADKMYFGFKSDNVLCSMFCTAGKAHMQQHTDTSFSSLSLSFFSSVSFPLQLTFTHTRSCNMWLIKYERQNRHQNVTLSISSVYWFCGNSWKALQIKGIWLIFYTWLE